MLIIIHVKARRRLTFRVTNALTARLSDARELPALNPTSRTRAGCAITTMGMLLAGIDSLGTLALSQEQYQGQGGSPGSDMYYCATGKSSTPSSASSLRYPIPSALPDSK
jgi:hypothetical protein